MTIRGLLAVGRSAGSRREQVSKWCVLIHGSKALILLKERYFRSDKPTLLERQHQFLERALFIVRVLMSTHSVVHFLKGTVHSSQLCLTEFLLSTMFRSISISPASGSEDPVSVQEKLMDVLMLVVAAPL
jgi:hypothetical protein